MTRRVIALTHGQIEKVNRLKRFFIANSRIPKETEFARLEGTTPAYAHEAFRALRENKILVRAKSAHVVWEWSKVPYEVINVRKTV